MNSNELRSKSGAVQLLSETKVEDEKPEASQVGWCGYLVHKVATLPQNVCSAIYYVAKNCICDRIAMLWHTCPDASGAQQELASVQQELVGLRERHSSQIRSLKDSRQEADRENKEKLCELEAEHQNKLRTNQTGYQYQLQAQFNAGRHEVRLAQQANQTELEELQVQLATLKEQLNTALSVGTDPAARKALIDKLQRARQEIRTKFAEVFEKGLLKDALEQVFGNEGKNVNLPAIKNRMEDQLNRLLDYCSYVHFERVAFRQGDGFISETERERFILDGLSGMSQLQNIVRQALESAAKTRDELTAEQEKSDILEETVAQQAQQLRTQASDFAAQKARMKEQMQTMQAEMDALREECSRTASQYEEVGTRQQQELLKVTSANASLLEANVALKQQVQDVTNDKLGLKVANEALEKCNEEFQTGISAIFTKYAGKAFSTQNLIGKIRAIISLLNSKDKLQMQHMQHMQDDIKRLVKEANIVTV